MEDLIEALVEKLPKPAPPCTPCGTPQRESDDVCFYVGVRLFAVGVLVGLVVSLVIYLVIRCCSCRRHFERAARDGASLLAVQDVETPESRRLRAELSR